MGPGAGGLNACGRVSGSVGANQGGAVLRRVPSVPETKPLLGGPPVLSGSARSGEATSSKRSPLV